MSPRPSSLVTRPAAEGDALPHIVVLGAGFAGLKFCQAFPEGLAKITIIDRQNHHLFQPLLYQVATAGLSAPDIAQPVRGIFADRPHLHVVMGEVTGFDVPAKKVLLQGGRGVGYDYLVVALGSVTGYFGNNHWAEHAPGLKSLDDALAMRRRLLTAFEEAEISDDTERIKKLMTIVVVGGGPTGVELAGAFAELARTVLRKDFDRIDPTKARVVLIEGSDRLLGQFPPDLAESARKDLVKLGVEVKLSTRVQRIEAGRVVLTPDETLEAANIVWAAGVAGNPVAAKLGAEVDRGGRVKIGPDLNLPGHPEIFVLGDMVAMTDAAGKPVPGLAPAAMQMGIHAAKTIASRISLGKQAAPKGGFVYRDKGSMATIGRSAAVAMIGRVRFTGFMAWLTWLVVHLLFLVSFRSKTSVIMQWMYSYFTYKRGARLITGVSGEKSAGSA